MSQIILHRSSSPTSRRIWLLAGALFCAMAVTPPAGAQSSGTQPPAAKPAAATSKTGAGKASAAQVPVAKAPVGKTAGVKPAVPPASATAKSELIDINHATIAQLRTIPGIGDAYAKKIVAGRPFANKSQLVSRNIIKPELYELIQTRIIAKQ